MNGVLFIDLTSGALIASRAYGKSPSFTKAVSDHMNLGALMFALRKYSEDVLKGSFNEKNLMESTARNCKVMPSKLSTIRMGNEILYFAEYHGIEASILTVSFSTIEFGSEVARQVAIRATRKLAKHEDILVDRPKGYSSKIRKILDSILNKILVNSALEIGKEIRRKAIRPDWVVYIWAPKGLRTIFEDISRRITKEEMNRAPKRKLSKYFGCFRKKNRVDSIDSDSVSLNPVSPRKTNAISLKYLPLQSSHESLEPMCSDKTVFQLLLKELAKLFWKYHRMGHERLQNFEGKINLSLEEKSHDSEISAYFFNGKFVLLPSKSAAPQSIEQLRTFARSIHHLWNGSPSSFSTVSLSADNVHCPFSH